MKVALKLPRISMNMDEGTVVSWRVKSGDSFKTGDILYEVETEKSTTEIEAPCDGKLVEIVANEGDIVEVGGVVCRVEQ